MERTCCMQPRPSARRNRRPTRSEAAGCTTSLCVVVAAATADEVQVRGWATLLLKQRSPATSLG